MSGSQMSVEGVSNNLDQNSGEIKVNFSEDTMTVDNSDNEDSSLVLMGCSTREMRSDEEPINLFCKQIGESIDENAVIYNDMRSVEEWLRNKSELDCDNIRNDFLYFSSDEISGSNEVERTSSPLESSSNQAGVNNVCNISWDDLVLDTDSSVLKDANVDSQSKSDSEYEIHKSELLIGLSKIVNPLPLSFTERKITPDSVPQLQAEKTTASATRELVISSTKSLSKELPFVRIPKNCLMKGKILGKGDISLLSGNNSISLLNSTKTLPVGLANVSTIIARPNPGNKLEFKKTANILCGSNRKTLLKQSSNVNNEKSIMVLPVKSVNKISNNTLIKKVNHSRSVLKSNRTCKSVTGKLPSTTTTTNSTQKTVLPVALVAISTNKSDNTTEIVITTEDGENVYKGKTSDIMKATGSNVMYKKSKMTEKARSSPSDKQEYDNATVNELMVKLFGVTGDALENFEGASTQTHLRCPVDGCRYTTSRGSWLKVHVLQHYGIRPFKCDHPNCTWAFYTNFRLKRHQEIHYKTKEFCCPVVDCGRSFSTIYNVNSHLKLHDRPTAVTCQINGCNRAFQTRRGYEKHLQEHGIEYAPYTCPKDGCGKKYFTINSLNSHSRIHQHSEEELRCTYCGKLFDQPCRLKAHINTHIGVKPYKCDYEGCMWAFTTSSKLRRHQRKHTQTRKHHCKVCQKSFLRSEHLKDHSLKHFVKKSFICPFSGCSTVFANKSSMYAHLKRHRNQELKSNLTTTFPCPMDSCSVVFNSKESLRTHMQLSHVLTGLMNNENSQDTIQMLSDDNLIALDNLQGNASNSGPGVVSFNSMSQEGLLVGMSDLVQCIPVMEQGDFNESNSSNNIITHVVFTDDLVDEEHQVLEEAVELTETENIGSARTGIPYQAGPRDKQPPSLESIGGGLHSASDVVLSAGLLVGGDNLERGLLLQDELSGGDLYPSQEEGLLGTAGELQVLLLDPTTREQTSEFEQSTINLRDLE